MMLLLPHESRLFIGQLDSVGIYFGTITTIPAIIIFYSLNMSWPMGFSKDVEFTPLTHKKGM